MGSSAPFREGDIGRRLPSATLALNPHVLLSECKDASALLAQKAASAENVIASWFDVISHIDRCEIGAARYYSGPQIEAAIAANLNAVAYAGPAPCSAQSQMVLANVRATNHRVQDWLPYGVAMCSQDLLLADTKEAAIRVKQTTAGIRCQINRDFPELANEYCQ